MRNMTELTQALSAYLARPVAQPLCEDSNPSVCASAAIHSLPSTTHARAGLMRFVDSWMLQEVINHTEGRSDHAACIDSIVELSVVRSMLVRLMYRLAGGAVSPEQATYEAFEIFKGVNQSLSGLLVGQEMEVAWIVNPRRPAEMAQQELERRKQQEAA